MLFFLAPCVNRIVQRMKYCSGTFSGMKLLLCMEKFWIVGNCCSSEGRIADELRIALIRDWTVCVNKSDV